MKTLIISLFAINFFSNTTNAACITQTQAQLTAWTALQNSVCHSDQIETENDYAQCEYAQYQIKNKMNFHPSTSSWTVVIREYECAAGASCWDWYSISCNGKLRMYRNGEN